MPTWYAPEYRPPLAATAHTSGFEPRRADLALWYLLDAGILDADDLHTPRAASWADLARVHSPRLLEALTRGNTLARIYVTQEGEMPVDAMLDTLRLACGGTIAATRHALEHGGPTLNLLGGFHHAGPDHAGALCAINDVAIALSIAREAGFSGRVAVLDLDAHPPDGIAACLVDDPDHWIGSLSGADWGPMANVDEVLLPKNTGDDAYLDALEALLERMPRADLVYVLAGGDVLRDDRLGELDLTIEGAARRDAAIADHLGDTPTVWLPAGGYTDHAWRVLAGTATVLVLDGIVPIPTRADPLTTRYSRIATELAHLDGDDDDVLITEADLLSALGLPGGDATPRLMGYYTANGIELALTSYGLLEHVQRLGYTDLRVELQKDPAGDVFILHGTADGAEHRLVEASLSREIIDDDAVLYVNWLTLRHPRAQFSAKRPQLPGQNVPGLGLAREATALLGNMAHRLNLVGVAFRPAAFHIAYSGRHLCSFADPTRQGRFLALCDTLAHLPLIEATQTVDRGEVTLDGGPYKWEADLMVHWLKPHERRDKQAIKNARESAVFAIEAPN